MIVHRCEVGELGWLAICTYLSCFFDAAESRLVLAPMRESHIFCARRDMLVKCCRCRLGAEENRSCDHCNGMNDFR